MTRTVRPGIAMVLIVASVVRAGAQTPVPGRATIETGVSASAVDNGYGNWSSLYARAAWPVGARTLLLPELATSQEFHDRGTLVGLAATQTLSDRWYAFGALSTSAGGFYLPRFRGTVTLNRKLLPSRRLVLNAGASYAKWKDAHSDAGLSAGGAYYFAAPLIVEVGTNRNLSRPGNVASQSYFAAVTEGRSGSHYLVVRASGGREAYAAIAPGEAITDFASHAVSLTWRQWTARSAGFIVGAERYANKFYGRTGVSVGAFWNIG